jgi:hypothetical protein
MTILSPGLVNRKGVERGTLISLAHKYMTILSPDVVNRKDVERGNIDISSTQIHDHSLSWLGAGA